MSIPGSFRRGGVVALLLLTAASVMLVEPAVPTQAAALSRPLFQLPFPCGETWRLSTYRGHDDYDIDMIATSGTTSGRPIVASEGGTVVSAGWSNGGGWGVRIAHGGGWATLYLHMIEAPMVGVNQVVARGQQLGRVGSTGNSSGPHLHYEQLLNGGKTESWFNGVPSGITSDGDPTTGPLYISGPVSPSVNVVSNNCADQPVEQTEYADIDGDGRADLIAVSGPNNDMTAYRNQGWGSPSLVVGWDRIPLVSGFGDASRTTFADVDGDGRADLIAVSGPNNDVTAYRNRGPGAQGGIFAGWDRQHVISGFGDLSGLKFADVDGDGRADLIAVSGPNNDVTAYRNQGWSASALIVGWDRKAVTSGFGGPPAFDLADVDGDGRADLIAESGPNADITAYRNQGWGASALIVGWDRKGVTSGFGALWPLKFADADGDDRADLFAVTGADQQTTAYRNQGWGASALIVGWDRNHVVSGFPA